MSEKAITLNEEQKSQWGQFRAKVIQQLVTEAMQVNDLDSIRYFVETGIFGGLSFKF